MKWVKNPSRSNVDNLNNVRRDDRRHCRKEKKECLKSKIEEHEPNSKIKNNRTLYRRVSDYKEGYQPRTNLVKIRMVICLQTPKAY